MKQCKNVLGEFGEFFTCLSQSGHLVTKASRPVSRSHGAGSDTHVVKCDTSKSEKAVTLVTGACVDPLYPGRPMLDYFNESLLTSKHMISCSDVGF